MKLTSYIDSQAAKVGDAVGFTTVSALRVNDVVVVPKGMVVSGVVAQAVHPGRQLRNGQVTVAVETLLLPSGEAATLRPTRSGAAKSKHLPAAPPSDGPNLGLWGILWRAPLDPFVGVVAVPLAFVAKGEEQTYAAGTLAKFYINGPLHLERTAIMKVQPPPQPAQVFFSDRNWQGVEVFCDQKLVGDLYPLRVELKPGNYSFEARRPGEDWKTVRVEAQQDHQYWIELKHGELTLKKSPPNERDIAKFEKSQWFNDKDFTAPSPASSCGQVAKP